MKIRRIILRIVGIAACAGMIAGAVDFFRRKGQKHKHKPYGAYEHFIKRPLDAFLATGALIIFSPVLLTLTIIGAIEMKGNPFFTQERPGWNEKIFKLIKFRSMNSAKDENGVLLPDLQRITGYGRFLRNTSLDELPELINIIKGDMSIVGPRPLLVKYLDRYNEEQHHRHDVRPGLTGYAQVHGRNSVNWEERFKMDLKYVRKITFRGDLKLIFETVLTIFDREGINSESTSKYTMPEFEGNK